MAKNSVSQWDTTAANNTDVGGINIAEGWAPSDVNNSIREIMAQVKASPLGPISTVTPAANKLPYFSGASTAALSDLTAFARTLLDDADSTAARTTLGLGNVDNTSDANKPISTSTQTALDGKLPLAGGTMTGQLTFNKTLSTSNRLFDLQQGYELYSDNTGVYGTSRLWLNTPSTGEVYIGPRSGVGFQLFRARALRVEFPEATSFTIGGNAAWHAGNDGAGSGLDADLLDGAEGAAYAKLASNNAFTANQSITGILSVIGGVYTYGHGGDNSKGIVRYNSTGTAYTLFDGSKFLFTSGLSITGGVETSSGVTVSSGSVGLGTDAWFYSYNGGAVGNVRAGIKCVGSDTGTLEFWAGSSKRGSIRFDGVTAFPGAYALTTASAANVNIDAAGVLARSTSSLRYKKDVVTYDLGIEKLRKLRPVTYKSKAARDGDDVYAGFIAEEVDAAGLTEFVVYNEAGEADALQYGSFTALLAKALQEAVDKIEAMEARLAALEAV